MQRLLFLYLKEAAKHHWGLAKMIDLLDHLIPKWPAICGFTGAPGVPNIYLHKAPLSSPVPKHPRPSLSRRCAACRGFWSGFWTPVPACATNRFVDLFPVSLRGLQWIARDFWLQLKSAGLNQKCRSAVAFAQEE